MRLRLSLIPMIFVSSMLRDGSRVEMVETSLGLTLRVPMSVRDPIDTVIVLETR